ncbi:MAG: molybdopterin molybdotransferase MoeA [Xanthomonadaceae bacterium]|nr:molybdopterin molybdotransferase MoeA [Xanthomonadaceae bacterium]
MALRPEESVICGQGKRQLSLTEALAIIRRELQPCADRQRLSLTAALGRVLAKPVHATLDVPGHDNSAMDGYAVRHADLQTGQPLRVIGSAFAGRMFSGTVAPGQCVRIMTGAVVPDGADTVVMQEQVRREGDLVWVDGQHVPGSYIRRRGEDLRAGDLVLPAGHRLGPADLGLLASLGIAEVDVRRPLRVAILSTGDELRLPGETLAPGQIYDSNRYTLHGMLQRYGAEVLDFGVVPDQPERLHQALRQASAAADVVITSGGVSVGEADYITGLLAEHGSIGFWRLHTRPGRPLAFGRMGSAVFFGLPGNPVSVMVTFYQIVMPALECLEGKTPTPRLQLRARLERPIVKRDPRLEFQRGVMTVSSDGTITVRPTGNQSSGVLRSMSEANCFIVLPEGAYELQPQDWVNIEPLVGFN